MQQERPGAEVFRKPAAMLDRNGDLWQFTLLGAHAFRVGTRGEAHSTAVCEAVRQDE